MKPLKGPVKLMLEFCFAMPTSWPKWKKAWATAEWEMGYLVPMATRRRYDLTDLVKAAEDALTGVIWEDDGQVVEQETSKGYGPKPGVWVRVLELGGLPEKKEKMDHEGHEEREERDE
jgi:Holliday junction resolvase RusA-like endonuclease